jgi:hypothetical protein
VGSADVAEVAANRGIAVAEIGSYFLTSDGKSIQEKYVGTGLSTDNLAAGENIAVAALGSYFLVFDGVRNRVLENYIGSTGQVQVQDTIGVHFSASGGTKTYDLKTGQFH